MYIVSDISRLL